MAGKPFGLAMKAVVLDEQGRTLLIRRSVANQHFAGKWEWPGGKVDPGEDFAVAAIRETREETGLEVELTGVAGVAGFEVARAHVVMLCMKARVVGGAMQLSHEHDAFRWVPLSELHEMDLIEGSVRDCMLEYARKEGGGHVGNVEG